MKSSIVFLLGMSLFAMGPVVLGGEAEFKVSEFTFKCPKDWEQKPSTSRMRAAELAVPGKDGLDDAEVVFYYFGPSQGGSVRANVDRWLGQFQEPRTDKNSKEESKTVNGVKVTYVHAEGTYMSGPPFGAKTPKPDYVMLAAIVEGKQGSVFVKMTGPKAVVEPAKKAMKEMVEDGIE